MLRGLRILLVGHIRITRYDDPDRAAPGLGLVHLFSEADPSPPGCGGSGVSARPQALDTSNSNLQGPRIVFSFCSA